MLEEIFDLGEDVYTLNIFFRRRLLNAISKSTKDKVDKLVEEGCQVVRRHRKLITNNSNNGSKIGILISVRNDLNDIAA